MASVSAVPGKQFLYLRRRLPELEQKRCWKRNASIFRRFDEDDGGLGADNTDIDHQIDGVSGSFFDNSAPGRGTRQHKVGINTTDFTSVNGADAGGDFKWYGGIVVLRSLTQSDRDSPARVFQYDKLKK